MLQAKENYLGFDSFEAFLEQGLEIKSQDYIEWMNSLRMVWGNMTLRQVEELLQRANFLAGRYGIRENNGLRLLTIGNKKLKKELPRGARHSNLVGLELTPASWFYTGNMKFKYGFERKYTNVCPKAGICAAMGNCLAFSRPSVTAQRKRSARKAMLFEHPEHFLALLFYEVRLVKFTYRNPAIRLNVLSDIVWEHILPDWFLRELNHQIYDYTKIKNRAKHKPVWLDYKLIYSWSEKDDPDTLGEVMSYYGNVAMIFQHRDALPIEYMGYPVLDGDEHDYRIGDDHGYIIGLKTKAGLRKTSNKDSAIISR